MLIYALPVALLLAGGIVGSHWSTESASRDGFAAIGSLLGLAGGFFLAKWLAKRQRVMAVAVPLVQSPVSIKLE